MSIRLNEDLDYVLQFLFDIKGVVTEKNIVDTLKNRVPKMRSNYNIHQLQQRNLIGDIKVRFMKPRTTTGTDNMYNYKLKGSMRGVLRIAVGLNLIKKSVLCTLIESINKISSFEATFLFNKQINLYKENYDEKLNRALKIAYQIKRTESQQDDLEIALEQALGKKQYLTYGIHDFGRDFFNLQNVFVVEGKNDLLKLLNIGYFNVMSLGGFKFDKEEVAKYLKDKTVIAFCDGDKGGFHNVSKLSECCEIKYIIPLKKHEKLEDLEFKYIMQLINNKIIFKKEMILNEEKFNLKIKEESENAWTKVYGLKNRDSIAKEDIDSKVSVHDLNHISSVSTQDLDSVPVFSQEDQKEIEDMDDTTKNK